MPDHAVTEFTPRLYMNRRGDCPSPAWGPLPSAQRSRRASRTTFATCRRCAANGRGKCFEAAKQNGHNVFREEQVRCRRRGLTRPIIVRRRIPILFLCGPYHLCNRVSMLEPTRASQPALGTPIRWIQRHVSRARLPRFIRAAPWLAAATCPWCNRAARRVVIRGPVYARIARATILLASFLRQTDDPVCAVVCPISVRPTLAPEDLHTVFVSATYRARASQSPQWRGTREVSLSATPGPRNHAGTPLMALTFMPCAVHDAESPCTLIGQLLPLRQSPPVWLGARQIRAA
jgi:hypothetical protein